MENNICIKQIQRISISNKCYLNAAIFKNSYIEIENSYFEL